MSNPLQKYFRQPKLYISLPSKGMFYEPGSIQGDYTNLAVYAMSGLDEIIYKTPDALFTGEATAKVIESCCPSIKNARIMPSIDIEAVMVAIRIATFGSTLTINHSCKNCNEENDYEIELSTIIDYFNELKYENTIRVSDDLTIKIRPLQYEEMSYMSMENFKLQKTLYQTENLEEKERQNKIDEIYQSLSELQLQLFLTTIEQIQTTEGIVTEKRFIEEWLRNTDRSIYNLIKEKLEQNKETWSSPKQNIQCANCKTTDQVQVVLDQSNFFV